MQTTEVYVVTHKKIYWPLPDYCRKMQINVENTEAWEGYLHDNDGDNISAENPFYCELTALYHLWKNSTAEIKGLYHYRRYFCKPAAYDDKLYFPKRCGFRDVRERIIGLDTVRECLASHDLLLAKPHNPFPACELEAISKFVPSGYIRILIRVIGEHWPDYTNALWRVLYAYQISYFNMFIAGSDFVDGYCSWLFDILARVKAEVKEANNGQIQPRTLGYLGEILLNVYVIGSRLNPCFFDVVGCSEQHGLKKAKNDARMMIDRVCLSLGQLPVYLSSDRKMLYQSINRVMRGTSPEEKLSGDPLEAIYRHYCRVGAKTVEKKEKNGLAYIKAVMDYSVANECFLCFAAEEADPEGLKNMVGLCRGIKDAEQNGSYTAFIRIYTDRSIDAGIRNEYFLEGCLILPCLDRQQ